MKSNLILSILLSVLSFQAYGQLGVVSDNESGEQNIELRIGVGHTNFRHLKDSARSFESTLYINRGSGIGHDHLPMVAIPVSVILSKPVQMYSAGVGLATNQESRFLNYQIGLAAAKIIRNDPNIIDPTNANRFSALLQNEISINLSRRLNMAVNVNLDLLNQFRYSKEAAAKYNHFDRETDYDNWRMRDETIKLDYKQGSMTTFTLKLSYKIFKK